MSLSDNYWCRPLNMYRALRNKAGFESHKNELIKNFRYFKVIYTINNTNYA